MDSIINSFDIWTTAKGQKSKGRVKGIDNISLEGITRLRKLILNLALTGKLSKQNLSEAVSEIDNVDTLPNNGTPDNWKVLTVKNCFEIKSGLSFMKSKELEKGEYLYLKVADLGLIENKKEIKTSSRYLNPDEKELRGIIPSSSIIFPKRGGAIATNKKRIVNDDLFVDLNIMSISPHKGILLEFAFLWINSFDLSELNTGTSVPQINHKDIEPLKFPVPPLAEQRRIVAKVDELMALCDQLEQREMDHLKSHALLVETLLGTLTQAADAEELQESWHRMAHHFEDLFTTEDSIDQLKQTILQLAVMGKLVPQGPDDLPASKLLEKIAAEKERLIKEGKIKKQKPLPEITEEEKPFELPEGWEFVKCSNLCYKITDGEHATPKRSDSGYYLLSARNVTNEGIILHDVDFVPKKEFQRIRKRCDPNIGDILISCSGSVGRVALVDKNNAYAMVRSAAMIRPDIDLSGKYLALLLRSPYLQLQIVKRSRQSAQANLFLNAISNLVFVLPPVSEQHRIVAKVDELFALCDQLEARITHAQEIKNLLANAVVEGVVSSNENND